MKNSANQSGFGYAPSTHVLSKSLISETNLGKFRSASWLLYEVILFQKCFVVLFYSFITVMEKYHSDGKI